MALPTLYVPTLGAGTLINGLNSGQHAMTDSAAIAVSSDQTPIPAANNTSAPAVAPTVSTSAYTAGDCMGSKMTFAIGGMGGGSNGAAAGGGILESVTVNCKSVQTTSLKLYLFDSDPSSTTFTDNSALSLNAADFAKLLCVISLSSPDSGLGTHTHWDVAGIGVAFLGANLYGVLVVGATPTLGSTSDINVKLGIVNNS